MATPVIQISPVDPALINNPDYKFMTEYQINTIVYVADSAASTVYIFANNTLYPTQGSYSQFQQYLIANPVTSVQPPPSLSVQTTAGAAPAALVQVPAPAASFIDIPGLDKLDDVIKLLRGIYFFTMSQATLPGNGIDERDFIPDISPLADEAPVLWQ